MLPTNDSYIRQYILKEEGIDRRVILKSIRNSAMV
jgi:hypothetical protein